MPNTSPSARAIVIGGSLAGLLAARVLRDHTGQVTIVDRDRFPDAPVFRPGLPQARHVHVLLLRGVRIIEQLFPGIHDELLAGGAQPIDWTLDCASYSALGKVPSFASDLTGILCSRDLIEYHVRRRLRQDPRIHWLEGHEAIGLLPGPRGSVAGAIVRVRGPQTGGMEPLAADLVVDASGRDSRAPAWLETLGYPPARETVVNSFLAYASRMYRRPANAPKDWKVLLFNATPPDQPRGGVIAAIEGDRWIVTLGGAARIYPPTDPAGFLAFAQELPSPTLYEAIKEAEPLTPIYGYRRTANRLRHFEEMPRWPDGFAALGDAVCCFNPVYGQGMTTAALSALALDRALRRDTMRTHCMTQVFQRDLARVVRDPWVLATGVDNLYPETEGKTVGRQSRLATMTQQYVEHVKALATEDPKVYHTFLEVLHLLAPPRALFRPGIARLVMHRMVQMRRQPQAPTETPEPALVGARAEAEEE